jgi:hypothetical protein
VGGCHQKEIDYSIKGERRNVEKKKEEKKKGGTELKMSIKMSARKQTVGQLPEIQLRICNAHMMTR